MAEVTKKVIFVFFSYRRFSDYLFGCAWVYEKGLELRNESFRFRQLFAILASLIFAVCWLFHCYFG